MPTMRLTKSRAIFFAISAAVTGSMMAAGPSQQSQPIEIGAKAPDFTLTDTSGKEHTLSQYTAKGQTVVLEWFSPDCPFVKKHYRADTGTMLAIQQEMKDEPVVWLRINSARAGHPSTGVERNAQTAKAWGIQTPILLDESGQVGMSYNAKRTPEMYIINKDGVLAYHGAIDNLSDASSPGDVNYVRNALQQVMAGETVTNSQNKPYGCGIKY